MAGNPLQWLEAYVLPLGHPFFAVSDEHGNIRIDNLPPGKWEFQVWHERCGYVKAKHWHEGSLHARRQTRRQRSGRRQARTGIAQRTATVAAGIDNFNECAR